MCTKKRRFLRDISGATTIEYGLVAGMISLAVIPAATKFGSLGSNVSGAFTKVANAISATATAPTTAPSVPAPEPLVTTSTDKP